jgi:uncharacterized LabA/DUF88 family protein
MLFNAGQLNNKKNEDSTHSVYVFIDAANLWAAQKTKGKLFDFEKLTAYITTEFKATTLKVFYYTAYPAEGTRTYSLDAKHRFFTFLKKGLGFVVRKKELKRITVTNGDGTSIQEKGNMDVEMTIDALHYAVRFDTAVFFTGDSDFLELVTYLRRHHRKVFIFSSKNNASQELKTGGDGYFDVLKLDEAIWGASLQHRGAGK